MANCRGFGCIFQTYRKSCHYNLLRGVNHVNTTRALHNTIPLLEATELLMPAYSPTMTEGTIVKWHKKEGDKVAAGDILCELKTDKAVVAFEADENGIFAKIVVPEGTERVQVGSLIGMMVEEGDDWKSVTVPAVSVDTPKTVQGSSQSHPHSASNVTSEPKVGTMASIGPSVRRLLEEFNVQPNVIPATGPRGRLLKSDVLEHISARKLSRVDLLSSVRPSVDLKVPQTRPTASSPSPKVKSPPTSQSYIDIPLSSMRATIAKRLTISKMTIPHAYAIANCRMDEIMALRKKLTETKVKVSMNDFIIKAAASALEKVPEVNTVWQNDVPSVSATIDVCVAVATEGGLIAPIVPKANTLTVANISTTVKDLADRARTGKLLPKEFMGGSFSISNLGMYGISHFTAVINPPQSAILAVGSARHCQIDLNESGHFMYVQLSHDIRVIDNEAAGRFLETFKQLIETPSLLIS